MRFDGFLGNDGVKKQLSAMTDKGHFPHALLIEGNVGSGRKTLATLIARAAVCREENPGARPCGVCAACRKAVHPDITFVGDDGGNIPVDTVRDVRGEAGEMPNESPYRVTVFLNAQNMLPAAQNALLKILEEPPAHVLFILTCENRTQLLPTILSRCVCLSLTPVEWEEAAPYLQARLPQTPAEELKKAHSLFGGTLGRVLDSVSDGTLQRVLSLVPQIAAAVVAPGEYTLLSLLGGLEKEKDLTAGVLAGLRLVFRDALAIRYGGTAMLSTAPKEAALLAGRLSGNRLTALLEETDRLTADLNRNMNNTLLLTRFSACLRQAAEG